MGQYNSGYRRPDFSGSQNFGVPSNSSLAPVPASEPKSKKKLLIIIAIAAVLLIVIFAIIGSLRKSSSSSPEWKNHASDETNAVLNRYANWLLFGEDSDEDFTKKEYGEGYDNYHVYYAEEKRYENDAIQYFKQTLDLYNNLIELYNADSGVDVATSYSISEDKLIMELVIQYLTTGIIEDDEGERDTLSQAYFQKGYEGTMNDIKEFYTPYFALDNIYANEFASNIVTHDENKVKIIDIYYKGRCIDSDLSELQTCNLTEDDVANIKTYMNDNSQIEDKLESISMTELTIRLEQDCWLIKETLGEK